MDNTNSRRKRRRKMIEVKIDSLFEEKKSEITIPLYPDEITWIKKTFSAVEISPPETIEEHSLNLCRLSKL